MFGSRISLDHAERSANLYAPFVSLGLINFWAYGAVIPMMLVTLVLLLVYEAGLYLGFVFAGETPSSFGSITTQVIGWYFSGHFAFMDARLFANPIFLLRVVLSISGSIWLVVRLLRHRIGMAEFVVFCALYSFNTLNIAMTLADIGPRAIEQLMLPLTEQGDTHELLEAVQLLGLLAFLFWIALHAARTFAKVEPLLPWQMQIYFHRNELRRFCLDELRKADGPVTTRDLAEKAIRLEGRDPRDRRLRNDMVRRIGKSLKLLRKQEAVRSEGASNQGGFKWRLTHLR